MDKKIKPFIRPFAFISSLLVFYAAMFLDGNILQIKDIYVKLLGDIILALGLAYIGGRSFEKFTAIKEKRIDP